MELKFDCWLDDQLAALLVVVAELTQRFALSSVKLAKKWRPHTGTARSAK